MAQNTLKENIVELSSNLITFMKTLLEELTASPDEEPATVNPFEKSNVLKLDMSNSQDKEVAEQISNDVFKLIGQAYSGVGGHGNVHGPYDLLEYDHWYVGDTDNDGKPNLALLASRTRNGSVKVSVFATDGSNGAKALLLKAAKEILMQPNWWAELPYELAMHLNSKGVPMVEDQVQVAMLLGKRIFNGKFDWLGDNIKGKEMKGKGYYERDFYGKSDIRAILGNVPHETFQKIQDYLAKY